MLVGVTQQDRSFGHAGQGLQHHRQLQFLPMACQLAWPSLSPWLRPGQISPKSPHCCLMAPAGTSPEGQALPWLHIRAPRRTFPAELTSMNSSCRCSDRKAMLLDQGSHQQLGLETLELQRRGQSTGDIQNTFVGIKLIFCGVFLHFAASRCKLR